MYIFHHTHSTFMHIFQDTRTTTSHIDTVPSEIKLDHVPSEVQTTTASTRRTEKIWTRTRDLNIPATVEGNPKLRPSVHPPANTLPSFLSMEARGTSDTRKR